MLFNEKKMYKTFGPRNLPDARHGEPFGYRVVQHLHTFKDAR